MNERAGTFVGRGDEVAAVLDALDVRTAARRTPTVCVVGPAGIGKTRLVAEVERQLDAGDEDAQIVWTRCWDGPGTPALWPWHQLLDQLGARTHQRAVGSDRFAFFDRIAHELRELAADRSIVLVIDDLHWADPASLELVGFLARQPQGSRSSILATYRAVETGAAGVGRQIARIEREATIVPVAGLDPDDVIALVGTLGRDGLSGEVLAQLHQRSGGNPFFLRELLHTLGDESSAAPVSVSAGLRVAVEGHLELLSGPCRRLLDAAAVQGRVFDEAVLASATQHTDIEVVGLLREAATRGVLVREEDQWRFEHALLGEVLVEAQSPHDVALHHRRTADGLDEVYGEAHPHHAESVANHLLAAGSLVTPDRLLTSSLVAARLAGSRLAWEDQSHHLATAVHALRSFPESDPRRHVEVLIERCEVEKQRRRLDVARDLAIEAMELARRRGDPVLLARVALAFPPDTEAIEIDDIHDPLQRPLRDEALDVLTAAGGHDGLRAELQAALALALYWETPTGDRAESHARSAERRDQLTAEALATARRLGDDHSLATALNARIFANWGPAMREQRPLLAEELIEVALRLGDTHLALSGRVWRVVELLETSRIEEAAREIDAFEREAARIRSRLHLWTVARWRATQAFMRGDLEKAEMLAGEALAQATEIMPDEVAFHFYTTTIGPIQYLRGELGDSFEYVRDTAAASANVPAWRMGLATIAAETGRHEIARRELAALADGDFAMLPRDLNFVGTMVMCALVAHDVEDASVASLVAEYLRPYAGRLAVHGTGYASYGAIDLALGQCAHVSGQPAAAREHYEVAIRLCDEIGSPYASIARLHLGRLLVGSDANAAMTMLERARRELERHELAEMAGRAAAALGQLESDRRIVLAKTATGWELRRPGSNAAALADLKGFLALRELLLHPGEELHALVLAAVIEGNPTDVIVRDVRHDVLDDRARREYQATIRDLQQRLEEADRLGDVAVSERISGELDSVVSLLAEATGIGGRSAAMRSDADRARVNVTKHLRRAIDRVAGADADLGNHLRGHVATGMTCRYEPGSSGYTWST